ncbi:MAG: FecR domain-containing protein [Myxococcota bacterium]
MSTDPDLAALARATEPGAALLDAVWRGVDARRAARPVGGPLFGVLARVTAGVALVVGLAVGAPGAGGAAALVHAEHWTELAPFPGVTVRGFGDGAFEQQPGGPRVLAWRWGRVELEVTPGNPSPTEVRTPDGVVTVVGTTFSVERSVLGTEVRVGHGRVRVRCEGEAARTLGDGEAAWCLPTTPAQLLARADRLVADGEPADVVRATIERGLARAAGQPEVGAELLFRRIEQDAAAGRSTRVDAASYLASGATARRQAVLTALARETYAEGGCAAGRASLEALHAETRSPEVAVLLATCVAQATPGRARGLLEEALGGELAPGWRERAEAWLRSL